MFTGTMMEQHPFFLHHKAYEDNTISTLLVQWPSVSDVKMLMCTDTEIVITNISFFSSFPSFPSSLSITQVMGNATLF